jgi:dihydroxy-acid dehydratase
MKVMELLEKGITARDMINEHSIHNGMVLDMAFGGSTNTMLHLTAIAHAAGCPMTMDDWDEVCKKTPNLTRIAPAGPLHIEDLYASAAFPPSSASWAVTACWTWTPSRAMEPWGMGRFHFAR